ncbi:hypothetical protein [Methylobacterium iners]|uniref:Uncharacterized protein n=1 Tax=Methylobacterium iners TaxID=418707 RepID=A0ABQ4RYT9_9HYPH|nr:hypothetical protein [Methylobacterium iners]GJD95846.1 hypothetical protein OCOJLMKI_3062 [Methylobacterium iners]
MTCQPTFGDLLRRGAITKADITNVVDAYMTNLQLRRLRVGDAYLIDPAAAVRECDHAILVLADAEIEDCRKRSAVRTALLLAHPIKA